MLELLFNQWIILSIYLFSVELPVVDAGMETSPSIVSG